MSALVESCMYVSNEENQRFVPWHGLGTSVSSAPTSAEAIKLAGLDWAVESKPIFTDNGIEIKGYRANTRSTDDKVLGIVSDRYQIVQNADAFNFTDTLIGNGCTYETAGSLMGGKKIWLLAKMPTQKVAGDDVDPFVCFTNNHTGFGSIQVCMTPVRVVCSNTLNFALKSANRKWTTRHIGDLQSKLDEAKHTLQLAEDYMTELAITADNLANITVTDTEVVNILDKIYSVNEEDSDRRKNNVNAAKEQFMVCMMAPDLAKFRNTAWGVVNAASDFATHIAPKRNTESAQENRFNALLDTGNIIIDSVFAQIMQNKLSKRA